MTPLNRDAAEAHYQALADAAQAPILMQLLVEARGRISNFDPLARRIDLALYGEPVAVPEDRDLVWECYGGGWAWFKADLTNGRQPA
jgi:hypothetical protein